jgi:Uma2 family endonuclease
MQTVAQIEFISVEAYLAAEESSETRHEYVGGAMYAMAGETRDHNQIVQNVGFALREQIKGGPCRLYLSDVRVNFTLHEDEHFYYPDIVVTCDKRDTHPRFVRHPRLIGEVLSESTERTDRREKFFAYTNIETLEEYVLVSQTAKQVTIFRRANGWKAETVSGAERMVAFRSLKAKIALTAIYEGV